MAAVDDEPELLKLFGLIISREADMQLVGSGSSGRDAIQIANRVHPDVLIMDVHMADLPGIDAAERIAAAFPSIGIILVTGCETLELVKRALRVGVMEFLSKPIAPPELLAAVRRVARTRIVGVPEPGMSRTWAFFGSKGTSGSTTLAVNTACALARRGHSTVLVDADPLDGDCAFQLDLSPSGRSLWELLGGTASVDAEVIEALERTWRSPLDGMSLQMIESGGDGGEVARDIGDRFKSVLDLLAARHQHVIVDLPPSRLLAEQTAIAADLCDDLVLVTNSDLSALKCLTSQLRLLVGAKFPLEKVTVLVNDIVSHHEVDPVHWVEERFHGLKRIQRVPLDRAECQRAVASGVPLVLLEPAHPLSRLVDQLIEGTHSPNPGPGDRSSWLERLWESLTRKGQFLGSMS